MHDRVCTFGHVDQAALGQLQETVEQFVKLTWLALLSLYYILWDDIVTVSPFNVLKLEKSYKGLLNLKERQAL